MCNKVLIFQLLSTPGIGNRIIKNILDNFKNPGKIYAASFEKFKNITGLSGKKIKQINKSLKDREKAESKIKEIENKGYKICFYGSKKYPKLLSEIYDPPIVLYVKGAFTSLDYNSVAVVGTRRCSEYGRRAARKISRYLARKNITVVSGCALGIDTVAHRGALKEGGRTVTVLGSGLDRPYPKSNKELMNKISRSGAVISEYPPGTEPRKHNFPMRNRIISGLCLGVVVVQAPARSGALITAYQALEQNREVFAVPGKIFSKKCMGTNRLIKEGAHPVTEPKDIVRGLEYNLNQSLLIKEERRFQKKNMPGLSVEILKAMGEEPVHIDRLQTLTKIGTKKLMAELTRLELTGKIRQLSLKRYIKE